MLSAVVENATSSRKRFLEILQDMKDNANIEDERNTLTDRVYQKGISLTYPFF